MCRSQSPRTSAMPQTSGDSLYHLYVEASDSSLLLVLSMQYESIHTQRYPCHFLARI